MNEKNRHAVTYSNPFGELIGLRFDDWSGGVSHCSIELTPQLMNPNGVLHGAIIYALADTGMGGALISTLGEGRYCTTVEIKISYFRSVTTGRLACESRVIHQGKRTAFLEATVCDSEGPIARASGTFAILETRQP